ncbi:unnamed protein product [Laminaria digitata]
MTDDVVEAERGEVPNTSLLSYSFIYHSCLTPLSHTVGVALSLQHPRWLHNIVTRGGFTDIKYIILAASSPSNVEVITSIQMYECFDKRAAQTDVCFSVVYLTTRDINFVSRPA